MAMHSTTLHIVLLQWRGGFYYFPITTIASFAVLLPFSVVWFLLSFDTNMEIGCVMHGMRRAKLKGKYAKAQVFCETDSLYEHAGICDDEKMSQINWKWWTEERQEKEKFLSHFIVDYNIKMPNKRHNNHLFTGIIIRIASNNWENHLITAIFVCIIFI